MIENVDGASFQQMVVHAAASINLHKQEINDLNVFPVPDGDTGTNMSLTIAASAGEMKKQSPALSAGQMAGIHANALLRGARGNSGVILSLLFRGFAKSVKELKTIDGPAFAEALNQGVAAAYGAVMKPAEGTILTVARLAGARASSAAGENPAVEYVLQELITEGKSALADTVNQNPVLKKAGVVDAGGKGLLVILQGMLDSLQGKELPAGADAAAPVKEKADFGGFETGEIKFGYCTEFICSRDNNKDPRQLRTYLNGMGDSLVLVDDDEIIKVHVHTNHPGEVLEKALTYGALLTVKVENMRRQHTEILAEAQPAPAPAPQEAAPAPAEKKYGFVAVCDGEGLQAMFRDVGVDEIVSGGQTMNPSTQDILRAVNATPAEIVYVLPNNKNIIMAAQQCADLVKEKKVVVLPTKTVPQGVSAMLAADGEAEEADLTQAMTQAAERVTTASVTYAARDSDFDGFHIKEGDYLVLEEGKLFATGSQLEALLKDLAADAAAQRAEFITIFSGADVTEADGETVRALFAQACPQAEVSLLPGGQSVYYYLISAE